MPSVTQDTWTINDFHTMHENGVLTFDTEYQRSSVWNTQKKQRLIDSIIKDYVIGMIMLRNNRGIYEVLDGQQRLRSILEFMDDEYSSSLALTPEPGVELMFSSMEQGSQRQWYPPFIAFKVPVSILSYADDATTADIFLRLQEGMELNTAERLNAKKGLIREYCLELSRHKTITLTSINEKRFGHRLIAAQIAYLERYSDLPAGRIPDIKRPQLIDMFDYYANRNVPTTVSGRNKKTLNFLFRALGNDLKVITRRGDFLPFYLLASYLLRSYVMKNREADYKTFLTDFLVNVDNSNLRGQRTSNKGRIYREYKEWRSRGAVSSQSMTKRYDIILKKYLLTFPDLVPKDDQRLFDYGQKLAIFYRDNSKCQICGKQVEWDAAEYHHKKSHSAGGETNVSNGELVHPGCHPRG
ncbi:HNH endonuclease family protein [Gemmatimonadota bacterium]